MPEIPQKRARRVTLQCLLMMFIAGVLGVPVSEAATVVLAWDSSPDPQVIGYNVYRSERLETFSVPALNGSTLVSENSFTDSTGEWNKTYYYVVTAVNAAGLESVPTAAVEAVSWLPVFPTSTPTSLSAPATTQPTPVGEVVTTSRSEDGQRRFEVHGASYLPADSGVPVTGDFDGDGQIDITVFRPDDGYWVVLTSTSGFSSYFAYQFGVSTDTPVPGDYDSDGRTDIAVFRPSTGSWYILTSSSDFTSYISY